MGILIFHKLIIVIMQSKLGIISALLKNSNIFIEFMISLIVTAIAIIFSLIVNKIIKSIFPVAVGEKINNSL